MIRLSRSFIRVNGIAVAGQCTYFHVIFFKCIDKLSVFCIVGQQLRRITMSLTGVSAGTDFNSMYTFIGKYPECFFQ